MHARADNRSLVSAVGLWCKEAFHSVFVPGVQSRGGKQPPNFQPACCLSTATDGNVVVCRRMCVPMTS